MRDLIKRTVSSLQNQFLHPVMLCMTCCTSYADIGTLHDPLTFNVIRTLHTWNDFHHKYCFPIHFLHRHIWCDFRFTTIKNGIGNRIHFLKNFLFCKASDLPSNILHTKNQLSATSVGKRHNCLYIPFTFRWNFNLELHIVGFTDENFFCVIGYTPFLSNFYLLYYMPIQKKRHSKIPAAPFPYHQFKLHYWIQPPSPPTLNPSGVVVFTAISPLRVT